MNLKKYRESTKVNRPKWFDQAKDKNYKYLLICEDIYRNEIFPLFIEKDEEIAEVLLDYDGEIKLLEIFDMEKSRGEQLAKKYCWSAPSIPAIHVSYFLRKCKFWIFIFVIIMIALFISIL